MDFVWSKWHSVCVAFGSGVVVGCYWPLSQLWTPLVSVMTLALVLFSLLVLSRAIAPFWRTLLLCGLLGYGWSDVHVAHYIEQRWPVYLSGQVVTVEGQVAGLPEKQHLGVRFQLTHAVSLSDVAVPDTLLLSWYADRLTVPVRPCQRWRFQVRLETPRGWANPSGYDRARADMLNRVGARGTVILAEPLASPDFCMDRLRDEWAQQLHHSVAWMPYAAAVLPAILLGDRRFLIGEYQQLFAQTGTSHLMAISGLHLALVSWGSWWCFVVLFRLVRFPFFRLASLSPAWMAAIAALTVAAGYGWISGFSLPTQRAWIMVSVVLISQCLNTRPALSLSLCLAMVAVLLFDPISPLGAGFWLSFLAVLIIGFLAVFGRYTRFVPLQLALGLIIGAVGAFWFALWPMAAWPANVIMIPLFSLFIMPMAFAGFLLLLGTGSWVMLELAGRLIELCAYGLSELADSMWHFPLYMHAGFILMALLACVVVRGNRLVPVAVLPVTVALWFYPFPQTGPGLPLAQGEFELVMLDVGQGTAMAVRTRNWIALYDAGPGWPGGDAAAMTLVPWLKAQRQAVSLIWISHNDLDHSGGTGTLQQAYPDAYWFSGQSAEGSGSTVQAVNSALCERGQRWQLDGVQFDVLWPRRDILLNRSNNHSCVVKVTGVAGTALLTGDIEKPVEYWLVQHESRLASDVMSVPHHGSRTSSSFAFIRAVAPKHVLVSAGWRNRFGHPADTIQQRYTRQGSIFWNTAEHGMLRIPFTESGEVRPESYRAHTRKYWLSPH